MFLRLIALAALLAAPVGAGAQTRTIVVPEGATVVVPPRGAATPAAAPRPVAQRRRLPPLEPAREGRAGAGWAAAGVVLPAIAAAAAALVLSTDGTGAPQGTTAPVRTR